MKHKHSLTHGAGEDSSNDMKRVVAAIVGMDLDLYPGLIHPNDNRETPGILSHLS